MVLYFIISLALSLVMTYNIGMSITQDQKLLVKFIYEDIKILCMTVALTITSAIILTKTILTIEKIYFFTELLKP